METLTVQELRDLGKRLKLTGLSKLTKKQLQEKIEFAYKTQTRLVVSKAKPVRDGGGGGGGGGGDSGVLRSTSTAVIPRRLRRFKAVAVHDVVRIKVDGSTLMVHCDTGLCIDADMCVVAKAKVDVDALRAGKHVTSTLHDLTVEDIEAAKQLGLYAVFPENLDAGTDAYAHAACADVDPDTERIKRLLRLVDAKGDDDGDGGDDGEEDAGGDVADN